jgi:acyl carrier protein
VSVTDVESRVRNVIASIFKIPESQAGRGASIDTVEGWDSLAHMNLVVALEETFSMTFSPDDVVSLLSYEIIVETIRARQ